MADFNSNKNNGKKTGLAGDDRNLVLVDKDFEEADFEDKVWLFWKRHGKKTVWAGVLIFVLCFAGIVWTQSKQIRAESLRETYAGLNDDAARAAFAKSHLSDPIAGTVLLELAAKQVEKKDFAGAAENYELAARVFEPVEVIARDRSRFAAAECLYRAGQAEKAEDILKSLAGTLETDETVRGQAMWALALVAYGKDDIETTNARLAEMDRALGQTNIYREQMRFLKDSDPRLK